MNPEAFAAAGIDLDTVDENTDPSTLPPAAQELFASLEGNPPHMALGMIQEFTVTEAGTEIGPLPGPMADETAIETDEASSE